VPAQLLYALILAGTLVTIAAVIGLVIIADRALGRCRPQDVPAITATVAGPLSTLIAIFLSPLHHLARSPDTSGDLGDDEHQKLRGLRRGQ
jgi:hypothetical protein